MSQSNSTLNFLIHDVNGKPQMVKVVQNSGNQSAQLKIKPNPVKVLKLPSEDSTQVPVYRTVKLSGIKCSPKLVQLPAESFSPIESITPKTEPNEIEDSQEDHIEELSELNIIQAAAEYPEVPVSEHPEFNINSARVKRSYNMSHTTRRHLESDEPVSTTEYTTKRRKHADKVGKGLRHFSMKVCEKVRTKGFTSYNEVADELVLEFAAGMHGSADSQQFDQKNIRRRVYDALNVLMAMNIISKEKKEIRWLGLPTNSVQECTALEKEKQATLERIQKKTQQLQELILQHISFKSLVERNKEAENKGVKPSPSSAIHLPFIVVNTSDKALIDCSISNDKTEYMFNFNKRFQIHDDIDILKRMGLLFGLDKSECSEEDIERLKSMVPKSLESFVEQMARGEINSRLADMLEDEELLQEVASDASHDGDVSADERDDVPDYSDDSSDLDV